MFGIINEKRENLHLIMGCSRLGSSIATKLSIQGIDVVVIDINSIAFRKLSPEYSGFTIEGDATDIDVVIEAGINKATTVVAVTHDDNANLMIAQMAKIIFNVPTVITRLQDEHKKSLCDDCGIQIISPNILSLAAFDQLSSLRQSDSIHIDTLEDPETLGEE